MWNNKHAKESKIHIHRKPAEVVFMRNWSLDCIEVGNCYSPGRLPLEEDRIVDSKYHETCQLHRDHPLKLVCEKSSPPSFEAVEPAEMKQ